MIFEITNKKRIFYSSSNWDVEYKRKLESLGFKIDESGYCDYQTIEIEINTLEELIAFTNKYGECIIQGNSLEIYDDYAE